MRCIWKRRHFSCLDSQPPVSGQRVARFVVSIRWGDYLVATQWQGANLRGYVKTRLSRSDLANPTKSNFHERKNVEIADTELPQIRSGLPVNGIRFKFPITPFVEERFV
jgi:hypothetical protein